MSKLLFFTLFFIILMGVLESENIYTFEQLLKDFNYFKNTIYEFFYFESTEVAPWYLITLLIRFLL